MGTMSPLMRSECKKFAPNIFNKTKCANCFRQKEEHSAEALESNRATRKACKCGYLFVAPDWDFSNPVNRTKRWQRRWFVLYDDGELTYSVDEHPDTVPQAAISLIGASGQGGGGIVWEAPESETGHPNSLAVAAPDRVHFVRGDSQEETRAWLAALLAVVSPVTTQGGSRFRQTRHKRNATFPGGRSNPLSIGVTQRAIAGVNALSRQASPILRQRFNSCISPLHPNLPSDYDKEAKSETYNLPRVMCNKSSDTLSSTPLPVGSSSKDVVHDSVDVGETSVESQVIPKIQVSAETPLSRSSLVDLPPVNNKGNDCTEVFSRSGAWPSGSNERLALAGAVLEAEVKNVPAGKSFQSDNHGIESPKGTMGPWKKQSLTAEEKPALEKTVRGDPDGCVLDSMSSSSCCSIENERTDGINPVGQLIPSSNLKDEATSDSICANSTETNEAKISSQLSVKHGWLMKLAPSKEWSKHWFVLDGNGLLYYRDPSAEGKGILDGVVDLGLVSDIKETTVERNHGIQLVTWDGKQSVLSAVTPGIRTGWIAALRKAANLPPLPQKHSVAQSSYSTCDVGTSVSLSKCCVSSPSRTVDNVQQSCSELLNLMSSPVNMIFPPTFTLGIKEKLHSSFSSHVERTCSAGGVLSPNAKGKGSESSGERFPQSGPLKRDKAEIATGEDSAPNEGCKTIDVSCRISSDSLNFSVGKRVPEDGCINASQGSSFSTSTNLLSTDSNQSTPIHSSPPSCPSEPCQVTCSRNTAHKPPMPPAVTLSQATRRHSSLCAQSTAPERGSMEVQERTSSRLERPSFLPLKSSVEPKCGGSSVRYAPISYISSSASSCSLSDEDFRTASEASLHSTPMSELIVDNNCNSIVWDKHSDIPAEKSESSNSRLVTDMGNDLGSILPPSPPLNRTPISRVKERARSRVVRRSKTPPEESVQLLKIESLSKRVKELAAALATKEAELKVKESEESLASKQRTLSGYDNSKASPFSDGKSDCLVLSRQNSEEGIMAAASPQVLPSTAKFCEFEEGSPVAASMRRLSSSAGCVSLPRMGSLSDLTNVDLDLDVAVMDRERLIEEWCTLRARFEKAVREIHALRKELRACQGRVDALELESSATAMCLERERARAEADMSLMVNRVQDLTVKLSAAEKQVRQLKQKASRVESREKRRSVSLRGGRDRSGTDPSFGTEARLPKEISDRLSRLEACLMTMKSSQHMNSLSIPSPKNTASRKVERRPLDGEIVVFSEAADGGALCPIKSTSPNEKQSFVKENNISEPLKKEDSTSSCDAPNSSTCCCQEGGEGNLNDVSNLEMGKSSRSKQPMMIAEQKRERIQGRRRQRFSSRLVRTSSEGDMDEAAGGGGGSLEDEEMEDESSKGCDPLRILVRLSSLEGHVADYLEYDKKGKDLPSETSPGVRLTASEVNQVSRVSSNQLCPNCEKLYATIERMKKELLVRKHAIGYSADVSSPLQQDGDQSMVERYREEIEQLRCLCEKGMRALDASHQRVIHEMEEKHKEEVQRVHRDKEQALREETKATLAALDAMRKAHETEVQREVAKFKEEFSRRMSAKQEQSSQHKAEMEGIRQEILSLSQRYSSKCLECASLREQLSIAKGDRQQKVVDLAAFGEVRLEQS